MVAMLVVFLMSGSPEDMPLIPVIEGSWWTVAHTPVLPEAYQSPEQQCVDFAIWQAADGTWQLWSCIRHTRCGGHTRLLYGWEGPTLFDADWTPMGIKMESRPDLGEAPGGLQAPHVVKLSDRYSVLVGGGSDMENLYVAIVEAATGQELARITGTVANRVERHTFEPREAKNRQAKIRVVDHATGPWGHINFGGLYTEEFRRIKKLCRGTDELRPPHRGL